MNYVTGHSGDTSKVIIIDSGAPQNVIHEMTLFKSTEEIDAVLVSLANGHKINAKYNR